jgi:hypothetical protein
MASALEADVLAEVRRMGIVALESATPGLKMTQLREANTVFTGALQIVERKVSQIPGIENAKNAILSLSGSDDDGVFNGPAARSRL